MNVVLWILAGLLAVAFIGAGAMKLARSKAQLKEAGMGWVDQTSDAGVKAVGALEVLGGIGLVLPAAVAVAPVLVPIAATCLALVMAGAVVVHVRLKDPLPAVVPAVVLLVLSAVLAVLRFGPYAF